MALYALQQYLYGDLTVLQASAVQAANPTIWASPSVVPQYAYQPLYQIWLSPNMASGAFQGRIVYQLETFQEESRGDITLYGNNIIESTLEPGRGLYSNKPGATNMTLDIFLRMPEESASYTAMEQAELRIRYLLDMTWRKQRKGVPPYIPPGLDNNINGSIMCQWQKITSPPGARELISRYFVVFHTAVPSA